MRGTSIATVAAIVIMTPAMTACQPGASVHAMAGTHGFPSTQALGPAPKIEASATVACQDFGVWYASAGGPAFASTSNLGSLVRARAEAPAGGRLHRDLSALVTQVTAAHSPRTGRPGGGGLLTQTAAYAVERDCLRVNASSFPL